MSDLNDKSFVSRVVNRLRGNREGFVKGEDGSMIIFGVTILMMMLVASGMAVDFMRHENTRTRVQATVDRAILAAADLDQENDPTEVVESFFEVSGLDNYYLDVDVVETPNCRTVTAEAASKINTMFINAIGIEELTAPAAGGAEECIGNVEISLILDISGSMRSNSKIFNMKEAAKKFVDMMITEDTKDFISISMVPYSGQTNAGAALMEAYDVPRLHGYSSCVEFHADSYNQTSLQKNHALKQLVHFEPSYNYYGNGIKNPWCPSKEFEEILPFSNDTEELKRRISLFEPRSATGIHYAMKWGTALLDPEAQPVISNMIDDNAVPVAFEGRPVAFDDKETLKVVVLMTDGQNVDQYRIRDKYNTEAWRDNWATNGVYWWLRYYGVPYSRYKKVFNRTQPAGSADAQLSQVCVSAKREGIIVYSVGFEVSNHSDNIMRQCASTPSHYFKVQGSEITGAFAAIARSVNKLRLLK